MTSVTDKGLVTSLEPVKPSGQCLCVAWEKSSSMFAEFLHHIWCPAVSIIWSSCSQNWRQTSHCSASSRSCLCRLSWSLWSQQPGNKHMKQTFKVWTIILLKISQMGHCFYCYFVLFRSTNMRYLGCFKKHLPLVHGDLVGARLRSSKENDVFVWEGLQRFGLTSLVYRHVFSTHTQPQIMREASFFTL